MSPQDDVRFERINHVALLTLHRPHALNALTQPMVRRLLDLLDACERDPQVRAVLLCGAGPKAFCAGGDVVALWQSVRDGTTLSREFFVDEYRLVRRLHEYPKATVALAHGIAMGGGMGLVQGTRLRLVTPGTRMAMPETRIGLVPDVGATCFFQRMPAPLAHYLALTGATIGAADAIFVGWADAWLVEEAAAGSGEGLPERLAAIDWSGTPHDAASTAQLVPLRAALAAPAHATAIDGATLPGLAGSIYRHLDPGAPLPAVFASLAEDGSEWAAQTLATLRARSPLMLALTAEALRRARGQTLASCLAQEFRLIQHAIASGEFAEGVRAALIEKDQHPRWRHADIAEVRLDELAAAFGP